MIFSIHIDQLSCIRWGIEKNPELAILFSWIHRLPNWATRSTIEGIDYYHACRTRPHKDIRLCSDNPDTIYRQYRKLEAAGVIKYTKVGAKDFIHITPKGNEWYQKIDSDFNPSDGFESEVRSEMGVIGYQNTDNNSDLNPNQLGFESDILVYKRISNLNSQIHSFSSSSELPLSRQSDHTSTAVIGYKQPRMEEKSFPALPETQQVVSRNTTPETTNTPGMKPSTHAQMEIQEFSENQTPKPEKKRKVSEQGGGGCDKVAQKKELTGYRGAMCSMINQLRASKPEYGFIDENGIVSLQPFGGQEARSCKVLYTQIEAYLNIRNNQLGVEAVLTEEDVLEEFRQLLYRCVFVMQRTKNSKLKELFDLNKIRWCFQDIYREARLLNFSSPSKPQDPLKPNVERGFTPVNFGERLRAMLDTGVIDKATAKSAYDDYKDRYNKVFPPKY